MRWIKNGLIFRNDGLGGWRNNSALQPTPLVMKDRIRFFVGFRDEGGTSRIGYIDVDLERPDHILSISVTPVLDVGLPGSFDEFGVVPSAVIEHKNKIYLYYAGYQLGHNVRFSVLSGLAISEDGGNNFKRHSTVPVFERTDSELLFRVPHSVMYEQGRFRFWYGGGSRFENGKTKTLPVYDVRYLESDDGICIPKSGKIILKTLDDEYRIGRPYVIKVKEKYHMFFGYSTEKQPYQLGYAVSTDGISWIRNDEKLGLKLSKTGWDSEMMAYPSIVATRSKNYLFYNGNNYGHDGFGYATLDGNIDAL